MTNKAAEGIKEKVRHAYGRIASQFVETQAPTSCCGPATSTCGCGPSEATEVAEADSAERFYSEGELTNLPESVTGASLGCGNPTAIASLRPGDVVLDLGSGGGIDCFLAAKQVGPTGRVIGLDMTPEMIRLARRNAKKMGVTNVDFRYGEMEEIPLPDESVDTIISNCVINLSPDKGAVFAEAFRVLKPGGRVAVSDIVTYGGLPEAIRGSIEAWAGCLAGALNEEVYLDKMHAAGLTDVTVTKRDYVKVESFVASSDVQALLEKIESPLPTERLREQLKDKVASITVTARKPGG